MIGLRDTLIAGKALFLDMSVRVLPEEISIRTGELSKAEGPPQCESHHPVHEDPNRIKYG